MGQFEEQSLLLVPICYRTAADDVVSGNGKLERLIVAAQGVAASTAHLVVASRVKADRNSSNLIALSAASKDVTNCTGNVVATVKSCGQLVEESGISSISHFVNCSRCLIIIKCVNIIRRRFGFLRIIVTSSKTIRNGFASSSFRIRIGARKRKIKIGGAQKIPLSIIR